MLGAAGSAWGWLSPPAPHCSLGSSLRAFGEGRVQLGRDRGWGVGAVLCLSFPSRCCSQGELLLPIGPRVARGTRTPHSWHCVTHCRRYPRHATLMAQH